MMKKEAFLSKSTLCLLILFISTSSIFAEVKLPRLVSDGMVLQREVPVKIWGWASVGETVTIVFKDKSYIAKADDNKEWNIILPAQEAGGPYEIRVNDKIIKDVLFGDVWLCSGQSNMDLPIKRTLDLYKSEVEDINNPYIRTFSVPLHYVFDGAREDIDGGEWKSVTPTDVLNFSATAYFFGKALHEKYKVPIGLLRASQGGSRIECWMSVDVTNKYPNNKQIYERNTEFYMDSVINSEKSAIRNWDKNLVKDEGISKWFKTDWDDSDWKKMDIPGYWADKGVGKKNGVFWFRKEINLPESVIGKDATLRLGCIVDRDSAFVNGVYVGTTWYQYPPRIYKVPSSVLKQGKNVITVKVINESGRGGFYQGKPYKLITESQEFDLAGEWKYKIGIEMPEKPKQTSFQNNPSGMYNGMIAPLLNFNLKGVIWYQGESNSGNPKAYKPYFLDLIKDWRNKWNNPQLPFIYVQLPNYGKAQQNPVENSGWAELREIFRKTLYEVPFTGMAITIDVGEWNDIHPIKKKEVGERLALAARKVAYGEKNIVFSGPLFEKAELKSGKVIITFSSVGKGLMSDGDLFGFAIAGSDGKYQWAKAQIKGKDKVEVWSDNIDMQSPLTIKYAWAGNPDKANLKNDENIPASPFSVEVQP